MRIRDYTALVLTLVACGGCTMQETAPPAVPDATRFVPPAITTPVEAPTPPLAAVALTPPVTVPPVEALPTVVPRLHKPGQPIRDRVAEAAEGSMLTPWRGGFADNTSALLRYPYKTGAVYVVPTSPNHPTTLLLPPGLTLATAPVLDDAQWLSGGGTIDEGDSLQQAIIVCPKSEGLETTMPLLTKSGHLFLVRLKSQAAPGVLAVTWELPLLHVLTDSRTPDTTRATETAPKIDLSRLHTQYKFEVQSKHSVPWMPVEAYDDGRLTVIRFAESLEYTSAPVLMAVSADGKKVLPLEYVTYQVPGRKDKGEFYLTKGLYPRLRLLDATKGTVDIVRLPTPQPAYEETRHGAR